MRGHLQPREPDGLATAATIYLPGMRALATFTKLDNSEEVM